MIETEIDISTHTSLAGRDIISCGEQYHLSIFLLTRPSRDVTSADKTGGTAKKFLLTRPSRDVTKFASLKSVWHNISTHTSLAGRDLSVFRDLLLSITFLLTRPSRDVTRIPFFPVADFRAISTHTSLAGRDPVPPPHSHQLPGFLLTRPSRDVTQIIFDIT